MIRRPSPSLIQLSAIALWLGAAAFFSSAVAPALFAALPSRTLAGEVVGRLLPAIFYSGIVIGALAVGLEITARDGWRWSGRASASLIIIGSCAIAQFVVAPRIERVRAEIAGPVDALPMDDVRRVAFGRLHGVSVAWLGIAMLAAVVALVLAARSLQPRPDNR